MLERALDRANPVRPLRVAWRRLMIERRRMAQTQRGHRAFGSLISSFPALSQPFLGLSM